MKVSGVLFCAAVLLSASPARSEEEKRSDLPPILTDPFILFKPLVWNLQRLSMKAADEFHKGEPFEEFTRPPDIQDTRPLYVKARLFEEEIQKDFLKDSGRLFWSQIPNSVGDMAIWQGYYTAFRSFQYEVTKSQRALDYLRKAMEGHALLQSGYGEAYLVRGVHPSDQRDETFVFHRFHNHGESRGKKYDWVDDASGSSLTGVVFGLYCAYRYGNDSVRKESIRLIDHLARNLVKNNYKLLNTDGRPSRYGEHSPDSWVLGPHRVQTAIALLELASMATGDEFFAKEKKKIVGRGVVRKIAARGEAHLLWWGKAHHQHLAFMNYFVLMGTEDNADLKGAWGHHLKKLMEKYRNEGNAFFNFVYAAYFSPDPYLVEGAFKTLQEFSFPKRHEAVNNSGDPSIEKAGRWSVQPLPVWRRPNTDVVWQRDPYKLDGPKADRYNGIDFLLTYWMGRYLGVINPKD